MTIQFNTDKNINGSEEFTAPYINRIDAALMRFSHGITRVEVHLSDTDGEKNGPNTMRCVLEIRQKGKQPTAVTNQADTLDQAVNGALNKLLNTLNK